jgi:hypothetical protein
VTTPVEREVKGWLLVRSGAQTGVRYAIAPSGTRIGRAPENEIVLAGPEAAGVSARHAEVLVEQGVYRLRDLESTNGTYVDAERVVEAELRPGAVIRLAAQGPELTFVLDDEVPANLDSTQVIRETDVPTPPAPAPAAPHIEELLSDAVHRARRARAHGFGDQTIGILRDAVHEAMRHTRRRSRVIISILAVGLVVVSAGAAWRVTRITRERQALDNRIRTVEAQLEKATDPEQAEKLLTELDVYEGEGERLRRNPLWRVGMRNPDFETEEIRALMAEFGAEVYSVPSDFTDRVKHYIAEYRGPNRPHMTKALGEFQPKVQLMRRVLEEEKLPPDLAFVPVVESALGGGTSEAGAAGWWQFTAATARQYGLRVESGLDQRTDPVASTRAACRLLRDLIIEFGNGSSVMLALAAYNGGLSKVKSAVRHVKDPIRQRNFWYLYRTKALPAETREYVPKVVAAMIVGRNAEHYGF